MTRDAIRFTAALGERYLWVDALCLFQDDADSKHTMIKSMGHIYANSYITLVALLGSDASAGLPGVVEGSRVRKQKTVVVWRNKYSNKLAGAKEVYNNSTYRHRAWTCQEFHLSRRVILFGSEQAYFSCCTTEIAEDTVGASPGIFAERPIASHLPIGSNLGGVLNGMVLETATYTESIGTTIPSNGA